MLELVEKYPGLKKAAHLEEQLWINNKKKHMQDIKQQAIDPSRIKDAEERLLRFAPYIAIAFPETAENNGIIESPLRRIDGMRTELNKTFKTDIEGDLLLKMDSHLPISGSIKARGGIYEVLKYAETLAINNHLLTVEDNYAVLADKQFQTFFSQYTIQVASTGNLGLSIGIISAKLGFKVIVHMSSCAKQWKKDLLRQKGVVVKEYAQDYCGAVEKGREESNHDPHSYFVDDENSQDLFLGYSVAGSRLKAQLDNAKIVVDKEHPLFVYLPCGIGGAPGGVAYGLKQIFGDNVYCFFAEPTQACSMLIGMASGLHSDISVSDLDINCNTDADGLAVGRASHFVGKVMDPLISGIATIKDEKLYALMKMLYEQEEIFIEPSACAAFAVLLQHKTLDEFIEANHLREYMKNATHIAWATGGNMVPKEMVKEYLEKADALQNY